MLFPPQIIHSPSHFPISAHTPPTPHLTHFCPPHTLLCPTPEAFLESNSSFLLIAISDGLARLTWSKWSEKDGF